MSKLIAVYGPSFSGKTYLMSRIVEEFQDLHIVNFELFYDSKLKTEVLYNKFYLYIYEKLQLGNNVICESIFNFINNSRYCTVDLSSHMSILCYPSAVQHDANCKKFMNIAGQRHVDARLGKDGIMAARKRFTNTNTCEPSFRFMGDNLEEAKEAIRSYVFC